MTCLRIVIPLYLFDLSMIFPEDRYPLFRIILQEQKRNVLVFSNRLGCRGSLLLSAAVTIGLLFALGALHF